MVNALDMGLIPCRAYSAAQRKHYVSPKTEGFAVISRSKRDPYQDDLLYVRVINSSHNEFSSWVTAKYKTLV